MNRNNSLLANIFFPALFSPLEIALYFQSVVPILLCLKVERFVPISEAAQERASLCNVPPNFSEPVCMPDISENYLQQQNSELSPLCIHSSLDKGNYFIKFFFKIFNNFFLNREDSIFVFF